MIDGGKCQIPKPHSKMDYPQQENLQDEGLLPSTTAHESSLASPYGKRVSTTTFMQGTSVCGPKAKEKSG